jgi:hypothetical protein
MTRYGARTKAQGAAHYRYASSAEHRDGIAAFLKRY